MVLFCTNRQRQTSPSPEIDPVPLFAPDPNRNPFLRVQENLSSIVQGGPGWTFVRFEVRGDIWICFYTVIAIYLMPFDRWFECKSVVQKRHTIPIVDSMWPLLEWFEAGFESNQLKNRSDRNLIKISDMVVDRCSESKKSRFRGEKYILYIIKIYGHELLHD